MKLKRRVQIFGILLIFILFGIFIYQNFQRWLVSKEIAPKEVILEQTISTEEIISEREEVQKNEKLGKAFLSPQIYFSSTDLEQGDTLLVRVESNLTTSEISGNFRAENLNFFKSETTKNLIAILGIDAREELGRYNLVINFPDGKKIEKEINIIKREFPVTKLLVTKELEEKGYTPSKIIEDITTKENLLLKEVLSIFTPKVYFEKAFIYPLKEIKIVGAYGNIRKNENLEIQHLGVDLEADIGTPVYAVNDGRVSFSKELNIYGKTLIIDHGFGIFSLYLHLNEFKVPEGEEVKRGDVIGFSGNTGYSIAPHLHFSVKVAGSSVDPLRFIETTKREMSF